MVSGGCAGFRATDPRTPASTRRTSYSFVPPSLAPQVWRPVLTPRKELVLADGAAGMRIALAMLQADGLRRRKTEGSRPCAGTTVRDCRRCRGTVHLTIHSCSSTYARRRTDLCFIIRVLHVNPSECRSSRICSNSTDCFYVPYATCRLNLYQTALEPRKLHSCQPHSGS